MLFVGSSLDFTCAVEGRGWYSIVLRWPGSNRLEVAACRDQNAYIGDAAKGGKPIATCSGHSGTVRQLEFSPRGMLATTSWDQTTRIWDPLAEAELLRIDRFANVHFSRDGRWLGHTRAGVDVGRYEIFRSEECLILNGFHAQEGCGTESLAFSGDSQWIAAASNRDGIRIWETNRGVCVAAKQPYRTAKSVAFSDDDRYLITSGNSQIDRWEIHRQNGEISLGESTCVFRSAEDIDTSFSISCNQHIIAADRLVTAAVIDLKSGEKRMSLENDDWVNHVSISPDGQWAACGSWHTPISKVWNLASKSWHGARSFALPAAFPDSALTVSG